MVRSPVNRQRPGLASAGPEAPRLSSIDFSRLPMVILLVALIFFSSTKIAGDAAEYAYNVYSSWIWPSAGGPDSPLHYISDKSIHTILFIMLGISACRALRLSRA